LADLFLLAAKWLADQLLEQDLVVHHQRWRSMPLMA
jgi:hypothetical protein